MYAFVYVWRIAVNIFNIIVVLYVFSKLDTRDERLYVSILGLLYVAIRSIGFGLATGVLPGLIAVGHQVDRIRELTDTSFLVTVEEHEKIEKALSRNMWRTAIEGIGLTIVSLICLLALFNALNQHDF